MNPDPKAIAHWVRIAKQALADAATLRELIDARKDGR
jgi:hypothetical protein